MSRGWAGGRRHTALLDAEGTLWVAGSGVELQLPTGKDSHKAFSPRRIEHLAECKMVSSGNNILACIDVEGNMYCFGLYLRGDKEARKDNLRIPCPLQALPPIQSVACGEFHMLCVGIDSSVWALGSNSFGQLGLGEPSRVLTPMLVEDMFALGVACGSDHSLIMSVDGLLFACGCGESGQLGISTPKTNRPVQIPTPFEVQSMYCGYRMSLIRATDGSLWSTGLNRHGQLGMGDEWDRNRFEQIPGFVCSQVACGSVHVVAIDDNCRLWGWGSSASLQLSPLTLFASSPTVLREDARFVLTGSHHTLLLTTDDQVVACGSNTAGQLGFGVACEENYWALTNFSAEMIRVAEGESKRIKSARSAMYR